MQDHSHTVFYIYCWSFQDTIEIDRDHFCLEIQNVIYGFIKNTVENHMSSYFFKSNILLLNKLLNSDIPVPKFLPIRLLEINGVPMLEF